MNHNASARSCRNSPHNRAGTDSESRDCTSCGRCSHDEQPGGAKGVPSFELSISQAADLTRLQRELLNRAESALDQIALLASASSNADLDGQGLPSQLQPLATFLGDLGRATFEGNPVFGRSDTVVALDNTGNKLVMPGVYLCARIVRTFPDLNLTTMASITQLLHTIKSAGRCMAIDSALINENLSRLSFLAKQLETVKENLVLEGQRPVGR